MTRDEKLKELMPGLQFAVHLLQLEVGRIDLDMKGWAKMLVRERVEAYAARFRREACRYGADFLLGRIEELMRVGT